MAKSGLKHIDVGAELAKSEWESEESHELVHGTSFPSTPAERQLFYRDDLHKWYIYNGSSLSIPLWCDSNLLLILIGIAKLIPFNSTMVRF